MEPHPPHVDSGTRPLPLPLPLPAPAPAPLPPTDNLPLPLPRAALGVHCSPVECIVVDGCTLWLKREDRNAPALAGNKVRALQFLLAGVTARTLVLTLGGVGSTHVLATARHAGRLGARTWAVRWPHTLNPSARAVAAAITANCDRAPVLAAPLALLRLGGWRAGARLRGRDVCLVPFGGSAPAGIAGHVEAALELAAQVRAGLLPEPRRIVLPVGSGGTAAGLALGLAGAGLAPEGVGVRVGPRLGLTPRRLRGLARA
ncbi:MAG: pyridoxal-phosphate dependent enzyme, partial [Gemmatimonadaceae bacterium]